MACALNFSVRRHTNVASPSSYFNLVKMVNKYNGKVILKNIKKLLSIILLQKIDYFSQSISIISTQAYGNLSRLSINLHSLFLYSPYT